MRLLLPLLVGGFSLIGCSSDTTSTGAPSTGSGGAIGDSGSSEAAASAETSDGGEDSSSDSATGDSGSAPKAGFIGVISYATEDATMFRNSVGADFFDGPGNSYQKGCQLQVVGACQVQLCDYANGGDQTPPTGAVQSAGTLTVGGTSPTFSLTYDAPTMQYVAVPTVPKDKLLFAGGTTITFAAAGGDVPAFTGSIVAPTPLTIASPVLPSGAFSIDSSKDLVFTWTGSSVGMLAFNVRTITSGDATTVAVSFVSCQFVASALTGTIPVALLRKLTKTDATTTATLTTDLSNAMEVVAGDHMVDLAVGSVITNADGKTPYATTQVTIF